MTPHQTRPSAARRAVRALGLAILLGAAGGGAAGAQDFEVPDAAPGWVMTPSVSFGAAHDDNPLLRTEGNPAPDDTIVAVTPAIDLTYRGRQTSLGLAYSGSMVKYRTLDGLDSFDQGGRVELRHQASKRVGVHLRNFFSVSPTTDTLQIPGVPYVRAGTRQNEFMAGTNVQATKRLELSGSYRLHWIEFDRPVTLPDPLLGGGHSHGISLGAMQAVSARVRVGGRYMFQHALVGDVGEAFDIQNGEGVVSVQLSPTVSLEAGAGFSRLTLPERLGSRTGPAGRVSLGKRTEHAFFALSAARSFVPAFGFGGSMENSEISGSVRVPFARNRAFVQGAVGWRDSESVIEPELGVRAVWLQTTVGYLVQRWLRVEGFFNGSSQDTPVAGGEADRRRVGVQVVTLRPMRIR